jgi:hypothetical protein
MRHMRKSVISLALSGVLLAAVATASSAEESEPVVIDGVRVNVDGITTPEELDAYIASDASKTIGLDITTGEVTWVDEGQVPQIPTRTTVAKVCKTGNACLVGPGVPYADYGFTGAGTATDSWTNRTALKSGSWNVVAQFTTGLTSTVAKNTTVILTGAVANVTSMTLS